MENQIAAETAIVTKNPRGYDPVELTARTKHSAASVVMPA